ncbi:MAG TPA: serine hydrolase [Xanthobacteraceae bacterium]|jgi:D-alanyl-D-alanine carboxypeptidase|nr:serine hydrolase [Xanthobacteraceae bacterium]
MTIRTAKLRKLTIPFVMGLAVIGSVFAATAAAAAESQLLIEADSGKVLYAENATYPWHPASVTKLMTLYTTLRAVKEHRITLNSPFTVSATATGQAPSKMGFRPGTILTVDNAIKMMMVHSANDMAVVLAEGVSGSIDKFAEEMNTNAQRLGMTQTTYVNPNGLPDDRQVTSARDMAILVRSLLHEFPEYELYWHISSIRLGKRVIHNTNKLIDHYPGADGMKTGFICASGWNLIASATQHGRKLIAVVFGAPSARGRTQEAAKLLDRGFSSSTLSWLTPSLGTVDELKPIAAAPADLHDEMCGSHRKRQQIDADEAMSEGNDQIQSILTALAKPAAPTYSLTGAPLNAPPPLTVYVGPYRNPAAIAEAPAPEFIGASRKAAHKKTAKGRAKAKTASATANAPDDKKASNKPQTTPRKKPAKRAAPQAKAGAKTSAKTNAKTSTTASSAK